jgi:lipopolysaccharide transport system permease protein
MIANLKELYRYRELLWMWILRELKVRYKQSILGAAWAILQPLGLMLVFTAVFSYFNRLPSDNIPYPIFSYTALLPWTLSSTGISFAVPSLTSNMNLVKKIYFPREILPIASVVAAFADFLVASTVFLGLMVYYRVPLRASCWWIPVILAIQVSLTVGIVLVAATLNVWYRDIRFVVPLGIQLWMYASPVIYSISSVPESIRSLYLLNPMAGVISSYRNVILKGQPPNLTYLAFSGAIAVLILFGGYAYFKRSEIRFADVI